MKERVRRFVASFSPVDWLVLCYLCGLNLALVPAAAGPERSQSWLKVGALLALFVLILVLVRGRLLAPGFWNALLYRVGIYGTVQLTYFAFRDLLPVVNTGSLDAELYRLDLILFGVEPAMWLDRFVNPLTTEWFAFFYFGYFFLLAAHIFPILLGARDMRLLGEFTLGMLLVFCIGQSVYMLVPGFGPYRAMADHFAREFPSGLWFDLVWATVRSGGAMKDIFPSLHTAGPTFIALFSFRNRELLPFRYTWPMVTFFTANIIIATMFLRWHYVIDVFAGFALASFSAWAAPAITRWELKRRARHELGPLCPLFVPQEEPSVLAGASRQAPA